MESGAADTRRHEAIRARIDAGQLPGVLDAERPTWIPTAYPAGGRPGRCHYCGEPVGADEALLVRDGEQSHLGCEQSWRDLVA